MVGFLPKNSLLKFAVAAALVSMQGGAVAAGAFEGPAGIEGRWAMEVTVGASMRMKDADKSLIFIGNGGTASSGTVDDGNLNYQKGDVFNAVAKAVGGGLLVGILVLAVALLVSVAGIAAGLRNTG